MTYSPVFSFANSALVLYFVRVFAPFFFLFTLIAHQFMFPSFVDPHLSVSAYSLCFLVLFINSFFLFFHKKNQNLSFYLLFADVFFLSALTAVMGPPGLFFIFVLAFIQSFFLSLCGKMFQSLVFLFSLSIGLPLAFLWGEKFSFEDRLSLTALIYVILFSIFCFSWIFYFILKFFKDKKIESLDSSSDDLLGSKPSAHIGLSLDLARKLKPILNSLIKYFPENEKDKHIKQVISSSLFSPQKGRYQLEQMRSFILDFIEYAEPEPESLLKNIIDLKELIKNLLKRLETHFQRPDNLIQTVKLPVELKVKGSTVHLEKCFECILINSFEALKNQDQPEMYIQGHFKQSWAVLEFLDNGHGIESEDMKKVFDPLFSKRFGLRGLGLPYVQKIIKAHHGSLNIESSQKGTKITVKIPLIYDFYDSSVKSAKKRYKKVA